MSNSVDDFERLGGSSSGFTSLRLIVREENDAKNLFVRLSSGIAQKLFRNTLRQDGKHLLVPNPDASGWSIVDEGEECPLFFLPLCIASTDGRKLYASFNGGSLGEGYEDSIEIPRSMITSIGKPVPEWVLVQSLSHVEYALSILVEPSTVEDWELLEIYCDLIENGGLLSQVSVIYVKQTLRLRIGDNDWVQVSVKEITTRNSSTGDVIVGNKGRIAVSYALLVQNTEVIIAPKNRSKKQINEWSRPLRLISSEADWGTAMEPLSRLTGKQPFRVEPGCVLIHSDNWPFESKWAQVRKETSDTTRMVGVMVSSDIPKTAAALFIGSRLDLDASIYRDSVCLKPVQELQNVPLEHIWLEEVTIGFDESSSNSWNIPTTEMVCVESVADSILLSKGTNYRIPIDCMIPFPPKRQTEKKCHNSSEWFRIKTDGSQDFDKLKVIELSENDLGMLYLRRKEGKIHPPVLRERVLELPTALVPFKTIVPIKWTQGFTDQMNFLRSCFVTLHGVSGSGKTHNALFLSSLMNYYFDRPTFYLDCKNLQKSKQRMDGILFEIDSIFFRAKQYRHANIILDDLDSIAPNLLQNDKSGVSTRTHGANPVAVDQSKLITDRILHLLEGAFFNGKFIDPCSLCLIATCSSVDSINTAMGKALQCHMIHDRIPALSAEGRFDLLLTFIHRDLFCIPTISSETDIAKCTEGFLPRDLEKLSCRVVRSYRADSCENSLNDVLIRELSDFTPSARKEYSEMTEHSLVSWEELGGLFDVKEKLMATVRHPILYQRIYQRAQVRLPRGILLYGPSGCGKSCLVPALAKECGYPLISCRGPEVLDKYIGASEAKVRNLFERASEVAPSILFLDELEALAPRRGSDSTGVTDRVVNQLLTLLDGVEDLSSGMVFIIGATSRPDKVDPAIVRPGRLERHLYVGPPTNTSEWSDLLVKVSGRWDLEPEASLALSNHQDIAHMANNKARLCPADLCAAFDTAHLHAVHRVLAGDVQLGDVEKIHISLEDIRCGIEETKASLSEDDAKALQHFYRGFKGDLPMSGPNSNVLTEQKISLR